MKKFFTLFFLLSFATGILKAQDELPEGCLYSSMGEVIDCEGWKNPQFPYVRDVKVEAYEGYTILRGWAGVENYDIMVEFDENEAILSVTPIVNGEEEKTVTNGYVTINTGREDFESINAYIGSGYGYAAQYDGESGYVILQCYLGEEWTYYYCVWPQSENGPEEWVNPFEGEATYLYSAVAKTGEAGEDWGSSVFPVVENIKVDVYDKYIYIHALGGVEGYDLKVAYDEEENVVSVITIEDGVESEPSKNYAYIYTGLDDWYCIQAYNTGYSYAGTYEDKSGYVTLGSYIYNADNSYEWSYYHISWDEAIENVEEVPEGCLYTSLGEVIDCEGWKNPQFPYIRDVKVEAYEGYTILRGWAGVKNYDIMVEFDENDAILSVTPIVNGEEGETVTNGYVTINTGREDFESINAYIGSGYGYAGQYDGESGYVILQCYLGEEWTYYYCVWPQSENGPEEWVNPFEGEATYLYSAVAKTGEAGEDWGSSVFPVVENIKVDVYDKYIYIHALGGVEGYDAKVAYDEEEKVVSVITIEDGVESEPSKNYAYIYTGRDDWYCIQAYNTGYSYAGTYEDKSGYVTLGSYIYNTDETFEWSYYHISWDEASENSIDCITTNNNSNGAAFNLVGVRVSDDYKGIVIKNGKKFMQTGK